MKKTTLVFIALSLSSSITFAKLIANMQVVCVETKQQEVVRTVYLTDDKTVLIADPISHLLLVDDVQNPSQDSILLKSTTTNGEESLLVKNSGSATLIINDNSKSTTLEMTCYSGNKTSGLDFSLFKNL